MIKKTIILVILTLQLFACHRVMLEDRGNIPDITLSSDDIALYMAYNSAMALGDLAAAEKYILEFLDRVPNYEEALIDLASIYTFTKRFDNAFDTIRVVIKNNPESISALMTLANIHIIKGDKKGAFPVLEKLVEKEVDRENYYIFLANLYMENKDFKKAKNILLRVQKKFPNSFFGMLTLARVYEELNMNEEAAREYEKAFAEREEDEILINLDNIYDKLGDRKKSIEVLERFIQRNPDFPKVRERLAMLYLGENDYDNSLRHIEFLINQFPDNLDLLYKAGFIAVDGERLEVAKKYIDRILLLDKKSDKAKYVAGIYYKEIKDWDKVIYYLKDIKDIEYHKSAKLNLAIAYEKTKRLDESYKILKELWELEEDSDAGYFLSLYLKNRKKYNEAMQILDKLIKAGETKGNRVLYVKAEILIKIGRFDEGISLIEEIISKEPDNPDALNFVGYSLLEKGKELERAYEYIKKALEEKPNDPYILDSLAWYYYLSGKYDKAYEIILKSYEKLKEDPTVLEHLGDILVKLNRKKEAKKFYEDALNFEPEDEEGLKRKIEQLKNF